MAEGMPRRAQGGAFSDWGRYELPSGKRNQQFAMENGPFLVVSPIENGDFL